MASDVYMVGRSTGLSKVCAFNSQANAFPRQQVARSEPGSLTDSTGQTIGSKESDIKWAGKDGVTAPAAIFLQPYSEGVPGTMFYLNIWGFSETVIATKRSQVWVPFFIAQLACKTGFIPGPTETSYLNVGENQCDMLWVTRGSAAVSAPGGGYAGYAMFGLIGARYFLVEFANIGMANTPANPIPGMNAFWRPY